MASQLLHQMMSTLQASPSAAKVENPPPSAVPGVTGATLEVKQPNHAETNGVNPPKGSTHTEPSVPVAKPNHADANRVNPPIDPTQTEPSMPVAETTKPNHADANRVNPLIDTTETEQSTPVTKTILPEATQAEEHLNQARHFKIQHIIHFMIAYQIFNIKLNERTMLSFSKPSIAYSHQQTRWVFRSQQMSLKEQFTQKPLLTLQAKQHHCHQHWKVHQIPSKF